MAGRHASTSTDPKPDTNYEPRHAATDGRTSRTDGWRIVGRLSTERAAK
jgi:hypothetical protein